MVFEKNYSLTQLNTLKLRSIAAYYFKFTNLDCLQTLVEQIKLLNMRVFILGGGSNIILPEFYDGLVIHNVLLGKHLVENNSKYIILNVKSGENWDQLVNYTLDNNWYGLENLSFIPGTTGGAPIQNIGAYGAEVSQFIDSVEVINLKTAKVFVLKNKECKFSYRNSIFKTDIDLMVLSVNFKLYKTPHLNMKYLALNTMMQNIVGENTPRKLRDCVIKIRQSKLPDPKLIGNVGSFFHNPILDNQVVDSLKKQYPDIPIFPFNKKSSKVSAGWLIDQIGLKGFTQGSLAVYDKQALVIVNNDIATQTQVLAFAHMIQQKVINAYGINLTIEPIVISKD